MTMKNPKPLISLTTMHSCITLRWHLAAGLVSLGGAYHSRKILEFPSTYEDPPILPNSLFGLFSQFRNSP